MKQQFVTGFLFSDSGRQLVVIHKNRPAWQAGKVNVPGGKVEPGETPLRAISREWFEETGSAVFEWDLFAVIEGADFELSCFMNFSTAQLLRCHTATDELIDFAAVDALPANMLPNARWLIAMALSFKAGERASSFQIQEVYA
jgi:8-oxo-dGTP diphosphatase